MKKSIKILIAVIIVVALIIGISVVTLVVNLTKEKTSISAEDFKNTMESKGYIISDATSQFSEYNYVKKAYLAVDQNYSYKIEFYTLEDENYAAAFYNNNKAIFESLAGNVSSGTNVNIKNYSKRTLSSNGKYMVVSRIGNTVIYLNVDEQYKDIVKDILNEFGY